MQLHIYKSEELIDELAKWIINYVTKVLLTNDRFTLALSGGETPKRLYQLLSSADYRSKIDWNKVHIFWGDERVVPFTDDSNNAKMAYENLLNNINVPPENIHIMPTDVPAVNAAQEYEKTLRKYFGSTNKSFDLVLLGMGKDGHTLSLFPEYETSGKQDDWVTTMYLEDKKMYRITLMPSIVNKASAIVFLVTGDDKANTLKKVLQGPFEPLKFPAQLINSPSGELHWFVDEAAAKEMN